MVVCPVFSVCPTVCSVRVCVRARPCVCMHVSLSACVRKAWERGGGGGGGRGVSASLGTEGGGQVRRRGGEAFQLVHTHNPPTNPTMKFQQLIKLMHTQSDQYPNQPSVSVGSHSGGSD